MSEKNDYPGFDELAEKLSSDDRQIMDLGLGQVMLKPHEVGFGITQAKGGEPEMLIGLKLADGALLIAVPNAGLMDLAIGFMNIAKVIGTPSAPGQIEFTLKEDTADARPAPRSASQLSGDEMLIAQAIHVCTLTDQNGRESVGLEVFVAGSQPGDLPNFTLGIPGGTKSGIMTAAMIFKHAAKLAHGMSMEEVQSLCEQFGVTPPRPETTH